MSLTQGGTSPHCSELQKIADYLQDEVQIGLHRDRVTKHVRYATLRTQALFDKLCWWYTNLFLQSWESLGRVIEPYAISAGVRGKQWEYGAKAYISCWFYDLYVSNCKAVQKVSGTAFVQHYHTPPTAHISDKYDAFLVHLNAIIRPTHIRLALEDTMWIPLISSNMNITAASPFGIDRNNWDLNESLAFSLLDRMQQSNSIWKVETLVSDSALGTPAWLLDWHGEGREAKAFAWFPKESNYSTIDLIAAYIIGEACTPNVGPCDVNDWQYYPTIFKPAEVNLEMYQRKTEHRFFGSSEYRSYEEGEIETTWVGLTSAKDGAQKRPQEETSEPQETVIEIDINASSSSSSGFQTNTLEQYAQIKKLTRFRIIDWTYHSTVVFGLNNQAQYAAMHRFCMRSFV